MQDRKKKRMRLRKKSCNATPTKRSAVRIAYNRLLKLFQEFNIDHVKTTSGDGLIRICCRTFEQLADIPSLIKIIFQKNLIVEIGMPIKHSFKMKTLVMHLKPVDLKSRIEIHNIFDQAFCQYNVLLLNPHSKSSTPCVIPTIQRLNLILNMLIIMVSLALMQFFVG